MSLKLQNKERMTLLQLEKQSRNRLTSQLLWSTKIQLLLIAQGWVVLLHLLAKVMTQQNMIKKMSMKELDVKKRTKMPKWEQMLLAQRKSKRLMMIRRTKRIWLQGLEMSLKIKKRRKFQWILKRNKYQKLSSKVS